MSDCEMRIYLPSHAVVVLWPWSV